MPQSITFQAGVAFGDSSLPVIPYSLTGAPAARARFLATSGTTEDAGASSWTSIDGAVTLTPVAGTVPGKSTVSGHTVVRFNGTSSQLQANLTQARPHSFALAFYVHTVPEVGTTSVIVGGQSNVSSDPAVGDSGMLTMGGPNWNVHGGVAGSAGAASVGWHTAVITFDTVNTTARIDGTITTRDAGQVPRKVLTLGGHRGGNYSNVSVAELVVWDGALTATQRESIEASMRAHYSI